jgi:enamine deaminase RidA (YjgF/YER057c/UK114 family)
LLYKGLREDPGAWYGKMRRRYQMIKISRSIIAAAAVCVLIAGISGCKEKGTPLEDAGKKIDQSVDSAGKNINTVIDKAGRKIESAGQSMEDAVKDNKN